MSVQIRTTVAYLIELCIPDATLPGPCHLQSAVYGVQQRLPRPLVLVDLFMLFGKPATIYILFSKTHHYHSERLKNWNWELDFSIEHVQHCMRLCDGLFERPRYSTSIYNDIIMMISWLCMNEQVSPGLRDDPTLAAVNMKCMQAFF